MLRLYDVRRERLVPLGRGEVTRVGPPELVGTYAWAVVIDVIRRISDRQRLRVAVTYAGADEALLNARAPQGQPGPAAQQVTLDVRLDFSGGLADVTRADVDPLALRLAFLTTHYRTARTWAPEDLLSYEFQLQRWRDLVAEWAESPSKPMCAEYVQRITDAVDDDLDIPTALQVLAELERDEVIPPGAKFETFVHLDELLGLDLARDIGRAPR